MGYRWLDVDTITFIKLYKKHECLWNSAISAYKDRRLREISYDRLRQDLGLENVTVADIKTKIKHIRTGYTAELNKVIAAQTTANRRYEPKLIWFPLADNFLRGVVLARRGMTSANLEPMELQEVSEEDTQIEYLEYDESDIKDIQIITEDQVETDIPQEETIEEVSQFISVKTESVKRKAKLQLQSYPVKIARQSDGCDENEFDLFGRAIGIQLGRLPLATALTLQSRIQSLITEEILSSYYNVNIHKK